MKRFCEKHSRLSKIVFVPILLFVLGIVGYLLLAGVYCLPTERMEENMKESCEIFEAESTYPQLMGYNNSRLDNYTDGIMLLTASHPRNESVWSAALNAERYSTSDTSVETILDIYQNGADKTGSISYARYWHGYLVILKPLLMIFGYGQIREIMMFVQMTLFGILLLVISRKNIRFAVPSFMMWVFLNPVSTMMSLQFNTVLIIIFAAMLAILYLYYRYHIEDLYIWSILFMVVGAMTSYFDLLTYPLVTLGVPLALWMALKFSKKFLENLKNIIGLSFFWCIGYGGMWVFKWILGDLITGKNVIGDAAEQVAYRTSSVVSDSVITFSRLLHELQYSSRQYTWIFALLLLGLYFIYRLVKTKKIDLNMIITFAIIAVYPMVWYFALKNHSFGHHWFTYRELAISIFAISMCVMIHGEERTNG